ncbi:MAG TPA: TonB-dependent receptor [Opitutaceae bacterium]|nr:TonB-dependent receptor [Opitutaceae bacterium]HND59986.1 TonB-dependent receptor [Opitutaceae bacterium]
MSSGVAFAQEAAPKKDEIQKLGAYEVTGSRIKRLDTETPSPVIRFTREELANTGFSTVDDALRALPFNNGQSIVPEGSGNGFASGTSTVNLRGLGNNNTLVLINGRRAVPSGAGAFNGFQSVVDLRQIPIGAIDAIEVLKDGASAIYGSDAVAGVLNIKLRRDYTGVGVDLSFGNTFGTDSFERKAYLIAGATTGRTNIVVQADLSHRNAIKDVDLSFSRTADLRADKTSTAQLEVDPTGNFVTGYDGRSSSSFPARFFIPGTATVRSFIGPTTDPNPTNALPASRATGVGYYDFQQDTYQRPEDDSRGISVFIRHEFSDNLYGFAELFFRRVEAVNGAAPSPFTTTDKGDGTNNRLVVPADSPYNPYGTRYFGNAGQAIELSTYRLVNAGPRLRDTTSDYPRLLFGLGGKLPKDWTWEAAYMFAQGSYTDTAPGTSFDTAIQQALKGIIVDGQKLYANPFGPEDPRVTDFYSGNNPTKTTFTANLYDASVSGDLFEVPAGMVGLAVGTEFRKESIVDVRTLENETGNVVGGAEGFGYTGKRNVTSAYAEVKVPLLRELELQLAARFEDYSDFGTTTKPKVALGYRPTSWLMLRGSYSQSFKAPDLAFLYSRGSVSFTGSQAVDPRRPDQPANQIKTVGRGNPHLQPETTDTNYFGAVIEVPKGVLKGLTFDLGFFRFKQKNLITRDTAAFTLTNELRLPAGRVVRKPLTPAEATAGYTVGILDYVATDWFNANSGLLDGYDLGVSYTLKTQTLGQFRFGLEATYVANYERTNLDSIGNITLFDFDGNDPYALWRGSGTISWQKGGWASSVWVYWSGGFVPGQLGVPEFPMADQWRVDPQVSYNGIWGTKVTVGVRNVFNKAPPRYLDLGTGYYGGVSVAEPAFWYVRLSREF